MAHGTLFTTSGIIPLKGCISNGIFFLSSNGGEIVGSGSSLAPSQGTIFIGSIEDSGGGRGD